MTKLPGGPGVKVFAGVSLILATTGYHVFGNSAGGKQGEHLFSQERPEAIVKAQEKQHKDYIEEKKARQEKQS